MVIPDPKLNMREALTSREAFLEADYGLGEAIQRLLEGTASREDCIRALLGQQSAYAAYVRTILESLADCCAEPRA